MTQDFYHGDRFDEDGRLKPVLADIGTGGSFVNDMSILFRLYKQGDISFRRFKTLAKFAIFKHKAKFGDYDEFVAEFNRFSFAYSYDMQEVFFHIAGDALSFKRFFDDEEWARIQKTGDKLMASVDERIKNRNIQSGRWSVASASEF